MLAQQQRPPIPLLFLKELRQLFPQYLLQGGHGLMLTLCRGSAPVLLRVQSHRTVLGEDNASGVCKGTKRKAALRHFSVFLQTEVSSFLQGMLVSVTPCKQLQSHGITYHLGHLSALAKLHLKTQVSARTLAVRPLGWCPLYQIAWEMLPASLNSLFKVLQCLKYLPSPVI